MQLSEMRWTRRVNKNCFKGATDWNLKLQQPETCNIFKQKSSGTGVFL